MDTFSWTYDGDRDCPGNPAGLFGCRCQVHRPDLHWPATAAVPMDFSGFTLPNTTATITWPPPGMTITAFPTSGTYVVPIR
jgi:hypothetical protein